MSISYPHTISTNSVNILVGAKPYTVRKEHSNYQALLDALRSGSDSEVLAVLTPAKHIETSSAGRVTVEGNEVLVDGKAVHNSLTRRILAMLDQGFSVKPLMAFLENLENNPSYDARERLYGFLEACNLPVTADGCFIGYKKVREDYTDGYTGTIDNSVGQVVTMDRNLVDDNPNNTCSAGLHICSEDYLGNNIGGTRVMLCKINPADVVTVPTDYNNSKMRVCRYEVVDERERNFTDDTGYFTSDYGTIDDLDDEDIEDELENEDEIDDLDDAWDDEEPTVDDDELTNNIPHNASLRPPQVRLIRRLHAQGRTTAEIKKAVPQAGVRTIRRVVKGEAYRWVT